jgi:hypothetical protein
MGQAVFWMSVLIKNIPHDLDWTGELFLAGRLLECEVNFICQHVDISLLLDSIIKSIVCR